MITVTDNCQRKITSQQRRLSKLNITDDPLNTPFAKTGTRDWVNIRSKFFTCVTLLVMTYCNTNQY